MAFNLTSIAILHLPHPGPVMSRWVPDWPALAAALLGAGFGAAIAFMTDRLGAWLVPERSGHATLDGFSGEFVSGMWAGGFDAREGSWRPRWAHVAMLAMTGACAVGGVVHRYGLRPAAVFAALFCLVLVAISNIHIEKRQQPDGLVNPLLWCGLVISLHAPFATPQSVIVGAVAGYLAPWLFCLPSRLVGRPVGSVADFKLVAATGAWLGVAALPQILAGSVICATVSAIAARLLGRVPDEGTGTLGPSIAVAAGITMLCGVWLNIPYLTAIGVEW